MLHRFRERFGAAGMIVAILALVIAVTGGAYAASGGLTNKQKKEVKAIAKGFQGTGPAGATGPAGPAGPKGDSGSSGVAGKSVTITEIEPEEDECEERGGALVKQEGASSGTEVCTGKEGSPWAAGGTLPHGATETGVYSETDLTAGVHNFSISFPIPLTATLPVANVHVLWTPKEGETAEEITKREEEEASCNNGGSAGTVASPKADPGQLCLFVSQVSSQQGKNFPETVGSYQQFFDLGTPALGVGRTGTVVGFVAAAEFIKQFGTWAVTGP